MAKKKDNSVLLIIIIVIVVLVILNKNGGFSLSNLGSMDGSKQDNFVNNSINVTNNPCSFTVEPSVINEGQSVTGTIIAEKNTICVIYIAYNGIWGEFARVVTNSAGVLTTDSPVNLSGNYMFKANCGKCRTNTAKLRVNSNPDKDSDGDGIPDQTEIQQGTDPTNPNSYPPYGGTCNDLCKNNNFKFGRGPVDSPGRCASPELWQLINGNNCCCTPKSTCDTICYDLGFNGARGPVSSLSECTSSESQKQQGSTYCCCTQPPANSQECSDYASRLAAQYSQNIVGQYPISSWNDCATAADNYCKSIGKTWNIYGLIDLSQCCTITCNQ